MKQVFDYPGWAGGWDADFRGFAKSIFSRAYKADFLAKSQRPQSKSESRFKAWRLSIDPGICGVAPSRDPGPCGAREMFFAMIDRKNAKKTRVFKDQSNGFTIFTPSTI
jgi:hypothetical protein